MNIATAPSPLFVKPFTTRKHCFGVAKRNRIEENDAENYEAAVSLLRSMSKQRSIEKRARANSIATRKLNPAFLYNAQKPPYQPKESLLIRVCATPFTGTLDAFWAGGVAVSDTASTSATCFSWRVPGAQTHVRAQLFALARALLCAHTFEAVEIRHSFSPCILEALSTPGGLREATLASPVDRDMWQLVFFMVLARQKRWPASFVDFSAMSPGEFAHTMHCTTLKPSEENGTATPRSLAAFPFTYRVQLVPNAPLVEIRHHARESRRLHCRVRDGIARSRAN